MAKNETARLRPAQITEDKDALANLALITGYTPADPQYAVANGTAAATGMATLQDKEAQAQKAADTARDLANGSEWKFHNFMLGAKKQVAAQFGDDSNEYQSMGLKKKSERKAPKRKPKTP